VRSLHRVNETLYGLIWDRRVKHKESETQIGKTCQKNLKASLITLFLLGILIFLRKNELMFFKKIKIP
jgi:hypothetical protein